MTHQDFVHLAIIYRNDPVKLQQVSCLMIDHLTVMVTALAYVGGWTWDDITNAGLEATYNYLGQVSQALPRAQA